MRRREAMKDVRRAGSSRKGLAAFLRLVLTWISGEEEATRLIAPSLWRDVGRKSERMQRLETENSTVGNENASGCL
jgi:hypothetical protein